MGKAILLVAQRFPVGTGNRYYVEMVVWEIFEENVAKGEKVRMVLVDTQKNCDLLRLDNHEPDGYHLHGKLPEEPAHREPIAITSHEEAEEFFMCEVERLISYEER